MNEYFSRGEYNKLNKQRKRSDFRSHSWNLENDELTKPEIVKKVILISLVFLSSHTELTLKAKGQDNIILFETIYRPLQFGAHWDVFWVVEKMIKANPGLDSLTT